MKKDVTKITGYLLSASIFFFVVCTLVYVIQSSQASSVEGNVISLEKEWTLVRSDGSREAIDAPFQFGEWGDTDYLEKKLPDQILPDTILLYFSNNSNMTLTLEGNEYLEYSVEPTSITNVNGTGWYFVTIPQDAGGKKLIIRPKNRKIVQKSQMGYLLLGVKTETYAKIVKLWTPRLLRNALLVLMGCYLVLTGVRTYRMGKPYTAGMCAGFTSVLLGVWMNLGTVEIPYMWNHTIRYMVLTSFMLIPVFLAVYLREGNTGGSRRWKKWYLFLGVLGLLNVLRVDILTMMKKGELIGILVPTHLLLLLLGVSAVVNILQCCLSRRAQASVGQLMVRAVILMAMATDLVFYWQGQALVMGNGSFFGCMAMCFYEGFSMHRSMEAYHREQQEIRDELQKTRQKLFLSQIRPHFIYNTLGAIRFMIRKEPEVAYQMTYDFSKYLRMNLEALEREETIPFSRELDHIKTYISLEQVRFGDALHMGYDIQEEAFEIPALTIQPLVENAIKHGIRQKEGGGNVLLRTKRENKEIVIEVLDDGAGFDVKQKIESDSRAHIGVHNVSYRLEKMLGASIAFESQIGKGTRVTIRFEQRREEGRNENNTGR